MSRRVVMRLTQYSQDIGNAERFLAQARAAGAGPKTKFTYAVTEDGQPCLYIELPEQAAEVFERKRRPKPPTKAQAAVQGQLQARRDAQKSGEKVPGHVPPVVRNGRVIVVRKKSPE